MVNGTLSRRASVSASSVLPQPVGPMSRILLLAISTSSLARGAAGARLQALVVVVHGHRQHLLGALLADDVLVEDLLDFVGLGQLVARALGAVLELLADDVVAQLDALVADEHGGAGDELANLVLALPAEGAVQQLAVVVAAAGVFSHRCASWTPRRPQLHEKRCAAHFYIARCAPPTQSAAARLTPWSRGLCMTWFTTLTIAGRRAADDPPFRP